MSFYGRLLSSKTIFGKQLLPYFQRLERQAIKFLNRQFTILSAAWYTSIRLPKPSRTGQKFIQLDPLEFLERISAFIPYPRHHR